MGKLVVKLRSPDEIRHRDAETARLRRAANPELFRARDRIQNQAKQEYHRAWVEKRRVADSARRELTGRLSATLRLANALNRAYRRPPHKKRGPKPIGDGLTKDDRLRLKTKGNSTAVAYAHCAWARCGRLFVYPMAVPTRFCQSSHAHRAHKRQWHPIGMTKRQVYQRDGWRCHVCGKQVQDRAYQARDLDPTCDHLIPVSHGGTDHPSNLALAHNRCNSDRGNGGITQLRLIA